METIVGIVAGAAALVAALGYLLNRARKAWNVIAAMIAVVNRELHPDHGFSMKDDLTNVTLSIGILARQVDDIDTRLSDHLVVDGPDRPDLD